MHSATGQTIRWRFATRVRAASRSALLAGLSAGAAACAAPRPDIELPRPRPPESERTAPNLERQAPRARSSLSTLSGDIRFVRHQRTDIELGEVVVTLRPKRGGSGLAAAEERAVATVTGNDPVFAPGLTLVRPGQPLVLSNRGPLVHRFFSPDLGPERVFELPPDTRSARISTKRPGPLRFYCSLHADETFVVLVEDAPWAEVITKAGEYRFGPVPPGRYTLAIWSEQVAGPVRDIVIDGYSRMRAAIWLDPDLFRP